MISAYLMGVFGDDLMVANAARVSFNKQHDTLDASDERLIRYLAREGHFTPFAHPQLQWRITAPIFVARQWFRSTVGVIRSEVSRRYVDEDPEFLIPAGWRKRPDGSVKQGSGGIADDETQMHAYVAYQHALDACSKVYEALLDLGIAPEQARMALPQSAMTQWIETGSLAYYARIARLRADSHAQREIQSLADIVGQFVQDRFPVSWPALMENGACG